MTIKKKLLTNFMLMTMILFTLTLSMIGINSYSTIKQDKENELISLTSSKSNELELWFSSTINEFKLMASLPSFITLDIREIEPVISNISLSQIKLTNLGVSTIDGKSLLDDTNLKYVDHDSFEKLLDDDVEYVIQPPSSSYPYYLICYPINNYNHTRIGFIYGTISNKDILEVLNELRIEDSITWLVDSQYNVITHNDSYFYKNYMSQSMIANAVENDQQQIRDVQGHKIFFDYQPIEGTQGLKLCTYIPRHIILENAYQLIFFLVILWIIASILFVSLITKTTAQITKPINELIHNMRTREKVSKHQELQELSILAENYDQMLDTIENQISEIYRSQNDLRQAELRSLQAQINPHFLYNSLDTIKWMAYDYGIDEIYNILSNMSKFFRISLSSGHDIITIGKELEHTRSYLEVQKIRYSDILDYTIECDPSLYDIPILKIIIQPLVENAIYHAIKPLGEKAEIRITVSEKDQDIHIVVHDTGTGIEEQALKQINDNLKNKVKSDHYGLYNINERLDFYYHGNYEFRLESKFHEYTDAVIIIKERLYEKDSHCG